ncbi:protein FAR1-RELATED SEQUENCE 5 isoform X1 [Aegilops tauschii subsp. strangulata]|uniref:SWIM-type domain-containing protein n=3 Tax=Aegilops tauschii subsp. strangulata TaxID=200361 RepID=A0A453SN14_AEGTS|nr:protein FAR1-RELATED SEQUENCE 5 isoform X1 [Aegilops tauschii subsp. strangulata]XP_020175361.1 protein FAR1-RELATED SEQUENCE 5 isoform X1 [Aegilops tauschii subsp. strangulata]
MTDEEKLLLRTLNSAKLPTRKIMDILSFLRHGPLPYTKKYVTNVRASIRKENDGNDMMQLLDYFRNKQAEDPRYYYKFKVHPQKPSKVLFIFWADGYSRKMYDLYGDSLCFDTTYKTNKYNLPFAPFVGVSGHGQNFLFACAIIQDETINTFIWLFQTFLECMGGKQPRTVITDQDTSMKEAVPEVFNLSKHRNCLFHVKKKAEEKCCRTFVTKGDLHADFIDIVHNSLTVAEFERLWQEMVQKYDIGVVNYFKIMWKERRRWAPVYFKTDFLPLLHSTSRSEGMNAIFKDNVASTDNVISFMTEYEKISERIQDMEREQDSLTRTTKPTFWVHNELEIQASRMYNRQIFYRFKKQMKFAAQLHVDVVENGSRFEVYKSSMLAEKVFRTRRYLVLANLKQEEFACICGKFQKDGIVCAHILRVLVNLNMAVLPDKYYIQRWKPKDRKYVRDKQFNVPMELTEASRHLRYSQLSTILNEMASDGARTNQKYLYVVNESERIFAGLDEMTKADELRELQARGVVVEKEPPIQMQVPHPDGYDNL